MSEWLLVVFLLCVAVLALFIWVWRLTDKIERLEQDLSQERKGQGRWPFP